MNGKILFVNPPLHQSDIHFPLNLGYLSAMLLKTDADVAIFDMCTNNYTNEDLVQHIIQNKYDLIGMGYLSARFAETILPLCKMIVEHKSEDTFLVLGGHGASSIPEYTINKTGAEVVAIGEAEEIILELFDAKINNDGLSKIKGIAYKENGDIFTNERRLPPDVNKLPFPAYDLFDMWAYTTSLKFSGMKENDKSFSLLTSRGCPFNCSFCYRLEKGLRLRNVKNVVEEMKLLNEKYGVGYYNFNDEYFSLSKKRLYEFRDELERNDLKIQFETNARVDVFDLEKAKILREMGCTFLNIGFESMSQPVLDALNKKTTTEQNIKAAEVAKKAKLPIGLNIIWGCPGDTEESLRKGVAFIKKYNRSNPQLRTIRPVTCYPGSPLYFQAIKDGLLLGPDDFFKAFQNSDLITVNFIKDMGTREMYRLLYKANLELIMNYHYHRPSELSREEADKLIDTFHDLYFLGKTDFRGARHYSPKDK